jgi:hypothetical protein
MEIGARLAFRDADWTVVGIFEADGGVHESELWGDAETVMSAYRRNGFQSVTVRLENVGALAAFQAALEDDPRVNVKAETLQSYFAAQSRQMTTLINVLGYAVGYIMAVGALFGALNTMYAAVSTREREIATLRAIGFGGGPILVSVMAEALAAGAARRNPRRRARVAVLQRLHGIDARRELQPGGLRFSRHRRAVAQGHQLVAGDRPGRRAAAGMVRAVRQPVTTALRAL